MHADARSVGPDSSQAAAQHVDRFVEFVVYVLDGSGKARGIVICMAANPGRLVVMADQDVHRPPA